MSRSVKAKETQRKYAASPKARAARARWLKNNPEKYKEAVQAWRLTSHGRSVVAAASRRANATPLGRKRNAAHSAVRVAIRAGRLTRPASCPRCGTPEARKRSGASTIEFHHTKGYEPEHHLTGEWLCAECHRRDHA